MGVEVFTFYKPLVGEEGEIFFYGIASRDAEHSRAWRRVAVYVRVRFLPNIYGSRIVIYMGRELTLSALNILSR